MYISIVRCWGRKGAAEGGGDDDGLLEVIMMIESDTVTCLLLALAAHGYTQAVTAQGLVTRVGLFAGIFLRLHQDAQGRVARRRTPQYGLVKSRVNFDICLKSWSWAMTTVTKENSSVLSLASQATVYLVHTQRAPCLFLCTYLHT